MKKNIFHMALGALLYALCFPVWAEQPKKVARIGYLDNTAAVSAINMKPFRERLGELGYTEGQNFIMENRYFEGNVERLPDLAAELVRLKCDVIVTAGTEAAEAAKKAIKTIPVVMAFGGDAVRRGFVKDLARPGGNITGLTGIGAELNGKRLELLKEVVPKLVRVGFLWNQTNPGVDFQLKETESVGRSIRLAIQSLEVNSPDDIDGSFQEATKKRAQAILVDSGGFFAFHRKRILESAVKSRLPAMYPNTQSVEAGGLMAYANDRKEQYRRAAEYVDKILKGAKPADLPVERPRKFEFVINLKAAKAINLTIPQSVLFRADKVIK